MEQGGSPAQIGGFRAAVLADQALQNALQGYDDLDSFVPRALDEARLRGFDIAPEDLRRTLRDDPIGLARWSDRAPTDIVPLPGWLPVNILPGYGEMCVDWAFFGDWPLREPFFEDSIRRVLRRPLNRLANLRTRLADFAKGAARQQVQQPSGLIFHMSRCGSTLVSQMLASDPRNVVISEASPIDTVVRLNFGDRPGAAEAHAALLAAMVSVLCQRRTAGHARCFVKLDSWHTLALPLFARAFPSVPWVFLYREPGAVLASQMVQRGIQTVPEYLPPALFGLTEDDALDSDAYCAQVLKRTCEAVLEPYREGGGLLVNYRDLPAALWTSILPHFGIEAGPCDRERMLATAQFDAKTPSMNYEGREDAKQKMLTDSLRAVADRHLGAIYGKLETIRLRAPAA